MAITITLAGSGNNGPLPITSTATGATVTASVGDWLVAISGLSGARTTTITDPGGNVWTQRVGILDAAGRCAIYFHTTPVTSAFSSGVVTAHYTTDLAQGTLQVYRVHPTAGETIAFITADTTGQDANTTLHAANTVSVSNGNIIFAAASIETNDPVTGDSDTANGSWSAIATEVFDSGGDVSSQTCSSQYKKVSATGNQSWACSTTSARYSERSYLVLQGTVAAFSLVAAQGQYTLSGTAATMRKSMAPIVAGAGSYALTGTAATPVHGAVIPALAGSYSLTGTDAATPHAWKATADIGSYVLTGTDATPFKTTVGGKTITAELGAYALAGTDANLLHAYLPSAAAGSYALTGTIASPLHGWRVAAGIDSGLPLLDESGNPLLDELGNPILNEGGVIGGTYGLTGSIVGLNRSAGNKTIIAEAGAYVLTGTDATLTIVTLVNKSLTADVGAYALTGTTAATLEGFKAAAAAGAYALAGTDAALSKSTAKSIAAESGSYALTGTDTTLTLGAAPAVPLEPSPLHIGEWPRDKKKRRRREDAVAAEQRARKRFRDAIGRLLEGLPPEFDEPADLDEALDSAVQASNLLYAMSAPIREINAVNELIDHIRQLRIAQPIAQLHLAQAYNQAHRHLMAKAQEDTVMALLLGE